MPSMQIHGLSPYTTSCSSAVHREPTTSTERAAWYAGLASPEFNGCGHVRLMLEGDNAEAYGWNAQRLARSLIKAFFG